MVYEWNAVKTVVSQNELKRLRRWAGNKRENKACLGKFKIFLKKDIAEGRVTKRLPLYSSHHISLFGVLQFITVNG